MSYSLVFNISSHKSDIGKNQFAILANKAKTGDNGAFGEIYNIFFQKIFRFIFYRVGHKENAEDLTEEVFLKAYGKLESLSDTNSLEPWLYQIARNKVIDYYREKKTLVDLASLENTLEYESNVIDVLNLESQQKIMLRFLKQLPEDQQQVLKMKFLEDLDNEVISETLGKTEGAIRVIQHRALTNLKELIAKNSNS